MSMTTKTGLITYVCLCTAFAAQGSTNTAYKPTIAAEARTAALCKEHAQEMAQVFRGRLYGIPLEQYLSLTRDPQQQRRVVAVYRVNMAGKGKDTLAHVTALIQKEHDVCTGRTLTR